MSGAAIAALPPVTLDDQEFARIRTLLYRQAGIRLNESKKPLVCGRLGRRLRHYGMSRFSEYLLLIESGRSSELQTAIDLLTTNETYFFREPKHFELLRERILPARCRDVPFRVWSAACSGGDEPYSVAMLLHDQLGDTAWEVIGSDLSTRVLEQARRAHYPLNRARQIPRSYLRRYCRRGVGAQDGSFIVDRRLSERVQFRQINLNEPLPALGSFDLVLLRNVMIYFDADTKRAVLRQLLPTIASGGYLMIGLSESLQGICETLQPVVPSVFRKA